MPIMLTAIILGLVQGLCEFLPVSSSGHLILFQNLFGLSSPEVAFDLIVHLATLFAVVTYYRKPIWALCLELRFLPGAIISPARFKELYVNRPDFRFGILVVAGSVPTALIGLSLKNIFLTVFSSVFAVGVTLVITGAFLMITGKLKKGERTENDMTLKDALIIGIAQGLAITPGISRSGATIGAGLLLGLTKETAARYSFIMSIPAILGAAVLELRHGLSGSFPPEAMIAGFLTALVSGYLALKFLVAVLKNDNFSRFAYWCWPVGLLAIALHFVNA